MSQLAGEAGGARARHCSSSWKKEMGSGPGTAVEKGPTGNAAQREAGETYPPQGLCQAGLGHGE